MCGETELRDAPLLRLLRLLWQLRQQIWDVKKFLAASEEEHLASSQPCVLFSCSAMKRWWQQVWNVSSFTEIPHRFTHMQTRFFIHEELWENVLDSNVFYLLLCLLWRWSFTHRCVQQQSWCQIHLVRKVYLKKKKDSFVTSQLHQSPSILQHALWRVGFFFCMCVFWTKSKTFCFIDPKRCLM